MSHRTLTRRPSRFQWAGLTLLLSSLLSVSMAQAGPTSPDDGCLNDAVCRGHYEQAVKQFESGRYELALGSFQAAYQRRQMPWLLINLGRTLHRLGRPREALAYYDRFRQAEARPDAETAARLEKYTAQAKTLVDTAGAPLSPGSDDDPKGEVGTLPAQGPSSTPTATAAPATTTAAIAATPAPAAASSPPIYKKPWFWAIVGGGAALIIGVGIGVGVAAAGSSALPAGVPTLTFKL
jgi:hypothetical protein